MQEIRKRRRKAEAVVGTTCGNQIALCLETASNSTTGFGNITEREEVGWG